MILYCFLFALLWISTGIKTVQENSPKPTPLISTFSILCELKQYLVVSQEFQSRAYKKYEVRFDFWEWSNLTWNSYHSVDSLMECGIQCSIHGNCPLFEYLDGYTTSCRHFTRLKANMNIFTATNNSEFSSLASLMICCVTIAHPRKLFTLTKIC